MGKRNAPCVIVAELPFDAPAGHTALCRNDAGTVIGLIFGCPCGCGAHYGGGNCFVDKGKGAWNFDGNEQKPTVTGSWGCYPTHRDPAVSSVGAGGYHWHGFLRAGVFEEC